MTKFYTSGAAKKIIFSVMLLLFASLILPAFVIQFMPDKVSEFYYREMTYAKIAADQEGSNKDETLRNLFEYVSRNIDVYQSTSENIAYSVVDRNPFVDAIRGVGWCDQQAFLLMNLLNKLGINKTRLRDVQAHTYSEAYIDNKWVIFDPYASLIFTDSNGAFLGIGELDKSRVSDVMGIINSSKYQRDLSFGNNYKQIYIPNEIRWKNGIGPEFLDYRSYDFVRRLLEFYATASFSLFGDNYYYWVQDNYLESDRIRSLKDQGEVWINGYSKMDNEAFRIFYKARNYDLANRISDSYLAYSQIIEQFQETHWAQEAKYYLAVLEFNNGNYNSSEALLVDLGTNHKTFRNDLVEYYLGLINLKKRDLGKAKEYFLLSDYKYSRIELHKLETLKP